MAAPNWTNGKKYQHLDESMQEWQAMKKPPGRARSHLPLAKQAWTSSIVMTRLASQPANWQARQGVVHNFHYSCSVEFAAVEHALDPVWEVQDRYLQSPSNLEAPNGCLFAGIAQHMHTRPMPPMLHYPARSACEEGSAASTEASKAHGCGHVWIQTVFVLIIFLGFSLRATQICRRTRKFGAVQFADDEQHSQCRELSDCHRRLQWPGSQSRTLHEAFHPPCGFALPLARSFK